MYAGLTRTPSVHSGGAAEKPKAGLVLAEPCHWPGAETAPEGASRWFSDSTLSPEQTLRRSWEARLSLGVQPHEPWLEGGSQADSHLLRETTTAPNLRA